MLCLFFFFKQKTAYEMRISDWSSDVCSSDLIAPRVCSGKKSTRFRTNSSIVVALRITKLSDPKRFSMFCRCPSRRLNDGQLSRSDARRSDARRVGNECVSTCRSRWSPAPSKQNKDRLPDTPHHTHTET